MRSANILEILWFRRTEREKYDGTKSVFNLCALFAKYLMLNLLAGVRQSAANNPRGGKACWTKTNTKSAQPLWSEATCTLFLKNSLCGRCGAVIRTVVLGLAIFMTPVTI